MNESCVVYGNSLVETMNIETKKREKGWCSVFHRSKSEVGISFEVTVGF